MKPSLGIGIILATLVSLVLFLFGFTNYSWLGASLLLLNGVWILVYGLVEAESKDKLYYAGWGLIMAGLSTFVVLPVAYTLGVTVMLVIVVIAVRLVAGSSKPSM
ncbi:MAG: hypothetical protein JRM82_00090 [Nitrososphaerota archaeon]|nr:hypothetical protein [Nitrososphaerota archaeon]